MTFPSRPASTLRVTLAVVVGAVLLAMGVPTPAGAAGNEVGDYLSRINGLRAQVGVQPLTADGELMAGAQAWADHMAAAQALSHDTNLAAGLTSNWTRLGENVGAGASNAVVWGAFISSAHHYANLVDPAFNRVGVGVAYAGGVQWTCQRFMAAGGGAPAPAPRPVAPRAAPVVPPRPPAPTTTTTTPAAPDPVAPAPVESPRGPSPPADADRVATMLAALRQLSA